MAKTNLSAFVRKLQKRMGEKPIRLTRTIKIKDFDEEIILESATEDDLHAVEAIGDIESCKTAEQKAKLIAKQNEMLVYMGSPTIRELAGELMRLESIKEPMEIMASFKQADVNKMAMIVSDMTVTASQPTIEEIDAIKNS